MRMPGNRRGQEGSGTESAFANVMKLIVIALVVVVLFFIIWTLGKKLLGLA